MALQASGAISLDDMHVEVGGTSGTTCSLNDADIRALISVGDSGQQSIQQYYGVSSETNLPTGGSQVNGQVQLKQITASSYISSGETLRVPSNMWVWSDSTSVAALIIDISCTVINDGKIIGKGGAGGNGHYNLVRTGYAGGPAINVTASGVTITNSSGAYIAGGGGGGGSQSDYSDPGDGHAGGGGGAGGGAGGTGRVNSYYWQGGVGGALNASGANGGNGNANAGKGGGSGGGGGGLYYGGGGGGRILPGVGGNSGNTGAGGSAGNAAVSPGSEVWRPAGGGGGWGAAGALGGGRFSGGAGGAAITGTSRTLNNSGTIYGST